MSDEIIFRDAIAQDIPPLIELYMQLASDMEPATINDARNALEKLTSLQGSAIILGELHGQIITTCMLVVIPNLIRRATPFAVIENVVTDIKHRNHGFGKAILDEACNRAWQHGCYKVMLSTGSKRPSTLAFYESAGFEQSRTGFQIYSSGSRLETPVTTINSIQ